LIDLLTEKTFGALALRRRWQDHAGWAVCC